MNRGPTFYRENTRLSNTFSGFKPYQEKTIEKERKGYGWACLMVFMLFGLYTYLSIRWEFLYDSNGRLYDWLNEKLGTIQESPIEISIITILLLLSFGVIVVYTPFSIRGFFGILIIALSLIYLSVRWKSIRNFVDSARDSLALELGKVFLTQNEETYGLVLWLSLTVILIIPVVREFQKSKQFAQAKGLQKELNIYDRRIADANYNDPASVYPARRLLRSVDNLDPLYSGKLNKKSTFSGFFLPFIVTICVLGLITWAVLTSQDVI